jgi:hypothetical protein
MSKKGGKKSCTLKLLVFTIGAIIVASGDTINQIDNTAIPPKIGAAIAKGCMIGISN